MQHLSAPEHVKTVKNRSGGGVHRVKRFLVRVNASLHSVRSLCASLPDHPIPHRRPSGIKPIVWRDSQRQDSVTFTRGPGRQSSVVLYRDIQGKMWDMT